VTSNDTGAPSDDAAAPAEPPDSGAAAMKARTYGIMALLPGASRTNPSLISGDPSWTNPNLIGATYRIYWADVEPSPGVFDWSGIDNALTLARANKKSLSITVIPGLTSPQWIYDLGAKPFVIAGEGNMPLPWDATFLREWGKFIAAFGARYDSDPTVAYLQMEGLSPAGECYFTKSPADVAELTQIAGTLQAGLDLWIGAAETIAGYYMSAFPTTPCMYAGGSQVPGDDTSFQTATRALLDKYGLHFGVKSNGLYGKMDRSFVEAIGPSITASHPVGFQTDSAYADPTKLSAAFHVAIQCGGQFVEVITTDANRDVDQPVIVDANAQLRAGH
jgi:hypothetical protein